MQKELYAHIPGYFVGTFEQFNDTFGYVKDFSFVIDLVNLSTLNHVGEVTFKWLLPDEVKAWVESRD